jgi:hypothetical protein
MQKGNSARERLRDSRSAFQPWSRPAGGRIANPSYKESSTIAKVTAVGSSSEYSISSGQESKQLAFSETERCRSGLVNSDPFSLESILTVLSFDLQPKIRKYFACMKKSFLCRPNVLASTKEVSIMVDRICVTGGFFRTVPDFSS